MYHITDLKRYIECPRLFKKKLSEDNYSFNSFALLRHDIYELIKEKLNISDCFIGEKNDSKNRVLDNLDNYSWFLKARFQFENLRVKVPAIKKVDDKYDIYFLSLTNFPNQSNIFNYCVTVWVLFNNGIKINEINVIHFNGNYIRSEKLEVDNLISISSNFYTDKNNVGKNIKESVLEKLKDYSYELNMMKIVQDNDIEFSNCMKCECCKNEFEISSDNSILTLYSSNSKYYMYSNGINYLKDVDLDLINCDRKQFSQILADNNGGLFVDKIALKSWIKDIKHPISFLDFEWETYTIPEYENMSVYDTILFQYSLHILNNKKLIHKDFIGFNDCREEFIINLINDLPEEGSVLAYNANAAEKNKLIQLSKIYPQYAKQLLSICDRIIDLQIPFEFGVVYDVRMRGHYSLKNIMNMLNNDAYNTLEVNNGMDAVYLYRNLDNKSEEEKNNDLKKLKEYCKMDTYSMYVLYNWFKKLVDGELI